MTLGDGGSETVSGLAPGIYTISEVNASAGVDVSFSPGDEVTVAAGETASVTVTNTYPEGQLTIAKEVDGPPSPAGPFTIAYEGGAADQSGQVTLGDGGSETVTGLAPGTYTISEVNAPAGVDVSFSPGDEVTVAAGETASVTVTNTYPEGQLTIAKEVDGPAPAGAGPFTIAYEGGAADQSGQVTLGDGGSETVSGLAPGTYTISEVNAPAGVDVSFSPATRSPWPPARQPA